jgi:16S rRNA (guanine966-N2)-methyltransferase
MRIVAGRHKGRHLAVPHGKDTRPTSDRVREAIYNVLSHGFDLDFDELITLDVCAGTGALGLEALSRGGLRAVFVDIAQPALDCVAENVETLKEQARSTILRRDVKRFGAKPASAQAANLAFFDPPYRENMIPPALTGAAEGGWLADGAVVVIETADDEEVDLPAGFTALDERRYGKTLVRFLKYDPVSAAAE